MAFGDTIRSLRRERNMKQDELANALGVSKGTISQWERNLRIPEMSTIDKVSDFFGVSKARLLAAPYLDFDDIVPMYDSLTPKMKDLIKIMIRVAFQMEMATHEGNVHDLIPDNACEG